ncbi:ROK family transcriptional regulator [Moorella naiadis]|uniref:ROK family transcriptional regulator n=1 Tax=Moorella naiadis (nom. illeg.) TaxID=3093670 RepID=UPI003D9C8D0E
MSKGEYGYNQKSNKEYNLRLLLNLIRLQGPVSRIELANLTGLSGATVSNLTSILLSLGLIKEVGPGESSLGRKPVLLELEANSRFAVGIDLGRTAVTGVITNLKGEVIARERIIKNVFTDGTDLVETVGKMVNSLISGAMIAKKKIVGLGIVAPGPLSWREGSIRSLPPGSEKNPSRYHVPYDWSDFPLAKAVQEETGLLTFVDNDANAAALAEKWLGGAKESDNFVCIIVGTGIGAGVIVDGQPYRGEDGLAAEIGHTTVNAEGPPCVCGNYGCLELYASRDAMLAYTRERLATGAASELQQDLATGELTITGIFTAATRGDALAREVLAREIKYLGSGVVNMVNLFNPDLVILNTREMPLTDLRLLVEPIQQMVQERAFSVAAEKVRVRASELGDDGPLLGGVTLVLHYFFTSPENL